MTALAKRRKRAGSVNAPAYSTSSIAKSLRVLECFELSQRRTLAELTAELRLPKSTLLRVINLLVAHGFLSRTAHGTYAVGLKVWRLGCRAINFEVVRDDVFPLLRKLVDVVQETAHYAIYEDGWSVYVEKVDGLHPIRSYTVIGGRSPAYATATGKALLAWQSEEEIVRIGKSARRWTDATHVGAEEVLRGAAETRRLGFAINRGEWRQEVWGIAAPVLDRHGQVSAAIGVSGPRERIETNIFAFSKAVRDVAKELSSYAGALPRG